MREPDWQETEATVYLCGAANTGSGSGPNRVIFSYEVKGHHLSGEFISEQEFREGDRFTLRFDPERPEVTDRTRTYKRHVTWNRVWTIAWVVSMIYWGYRIVMQRGWF